MYNKQDLQDGLDKSIQQKNIIKRFYHLRSIQNFIYFFDKLENTQSKEKVYSILMEYLEIVNKKSVEDIRQSATLFVIMLDRLEIYIKNQLALCL